MNLSRMTPEEIVFGDIIAKRIFDEYEKREKLNGYADLICLMSSPELSVKENDELNESEYFIKYGMGIT